jgi:hypothetical protein
MVKPSDAGRRYARGVRIDSCTGYDVGMRRSLALRAPIAAIVAAVAVWLALPASAAQQRTVMTRANQAMAEKAESAAARQMAAQFKWERIAEARDRGCPLHALRLPRDAVAKAAVFARHFGANDPRTVIVASVLATTGGSRAGTAPSYGLMPQLATPHALRWAKATFSLADFRIGSAVGAACMAS